MDMDMNDSQLLTVWEQSSVANYNDNITSKTPQWTTSANSSAEYLRRLQDLHDFILGIGSVVLSALGLIGNALCLCVLLRKDMKSTTYTFLTALAVADIMVLISSTLMICLTTFIDTQVALLVDHTILPHIYPLLKPAALTSVFTSIWVTVALSADRYFAVCHGMNSNRVLTIPCARKIVAAIFMICFLYNIPTFFECKVEMRYDIQKNQTFAVYVPTEVGKNVVYRHLYQSWLFLPFLWGIPFLCLAYMNTMLLIAVHKARKKSKELKQEAPKGLDVTIMLSAVVLMFLICQSPHLVATMYAALRPEMSHGTMFVKFLFVAILLVLVNSSTNFIIYTAFGKKFRRKFMSMFCKRRTCCGNPQSMSTCTTYINNGTSESSAQYSPVGGHDSPDFKDLNHVTAL